MVDTNYPAVCYPPKMQGTFVKRAYFAWLLGASLQTVVSSALNSTPLPKSSSALTPLSSLLVSEPLHQSFLVERLGFFLYFRCSSLLLFISVFPTRMFFPDAELEKQCLTRCSPSVAFPLTAPDMPVKEGAILSHPPCTPWKLSGIQALTEVQFTIILVVSKFKDGTPKAIKWIRSNLKKN